MKRKSKNAIIISLVLATVISATVLSGLLKMIADEQYADGFPREARLADDDYIPKDESDELITK